MLVCALILADEFPLALSVTFVSIPRLLSLARFTKTLNYTSKSKLPFVNAPVRRMRLYLLTPIAIADMAKISFWAILEADIGVICACMPRVYILFARLYRNLHLESGIIGAKSSSCHVAITGGSDAQRLEVESQL
jgi:hypothetical protein